jgi:hypothetical protein
MPKPLSSIRDLFSGTPVVNPTLREVAYEDTSNIVYEDPGGTFRVSLPGDPKPDYYTQLEKNPFRGRNPLGVLCEIQSGKLSIEEERQARYWLKVCQTLDR